jgi:hypothetical protein
VALLCGWSGDFVSGQEAVPSAPRSEESWEVIEIQGTRVGYAHSRTWETGEGDRRELWSETLTRMSVKRFGNTLNMTITQVTQEDVDGHLMSFEFKQSNPPVSDSTARGRVKGDRLELTTIAAGKTSVTEQSWDPNVKSPAFQDRILREKPLQVGEQRKIRLFDLEFNRDVEVTLTGETAAATRLLDGSTPTLRRVSIRHSMLPGMRITSYFDESGAPVKTETNLLGLATYAVSRDEALKDITGAEFDLSVGTLVRVDPMPHVHRAARAVLDVTSERPLDSTTFPASDSQRVEVRDPHTLRLTLEPLRLSDRPAAVAGEAPEVAANYLSATRLLECNDPRVRDLAAAAAGDRRRPADVALAMESHVHRQMRQKNFSTALATAAEVASKLEGDCTEHAVLLAAMLRAKEIPSRVAVGLVYAESQQAFAGHMWTEALVDGHWMPLDATLGLGGIGCGHIKLADSGLSDDHGAPLAVFVPLVDLLGRIRIRPVEIQDRSSDH